MTEKRNINDTYSREQDIKNTMKMREILSELPKFCKQYFRGIEETTAPRTRLGYAYDLRIFFEFLKETNPSLRDTDVCDFSIPVLKSIGKEDIEEFLEYLTYYEKDGKVYTNDERGKSRKLAAVRSLFRYYFSSEVLDKDVASLVKIPKKHEKPIIRLDSDEVQTLLEQTQDGTALTKSQLKYHERTKIRDVALLTLLLGTGIRVSECVGLDIQDINFKDNGMKVHRKGGSDAIVYFGDEVEEALKAYLEERKEIIAKTGSENALFLSIQNKRISVRAVEKLVKKYASLVTSLKKITPHKLRSTYGTSLYRATGDIYLVADVLGHKDVNTTRRHYAAIEEDRRRNAAKAVRLHSEPEDSVDSELESSE